MKVALLKPHTHDGKDHKAGESIDVTAAEKVWLQRYGVVDAEKTTNKGDK